MSDNEDKKKYREMANDAYSKILNRIKQARLAKKLNQSEVADIFGMTQNTYSTKEDGTSHFKVNELIAICAFLEIPDIFSFTAQDETTALAINVTDVAVIGELAYKTNADLAELKNNVQEILNILQNR